mgnify:CR=1 FL=1
MLIATYINKNYIKIDNYKGQQNFIVYVDELSDYNIGDRIEVIVDEYDVIEVIGLHIEPEWVEGDLDD